MCSGRCATVGSGGRLLTACSSRHSDPATRQWPRYHCRVETGYQSPAEGNVQRQGSITPLSQRAVSVHIHIAINLNLHKKLPNKLIWRPYQSMELPGTSSMHSSLEGTGQLVYHPCVPGTAITTAYSNRGRIFNARALVVPHYTLLHTRHHDRALPEVLPAAARGLAAAHSGSPCARPVERYAPDARPACAGTGGRDDAG